MRIEQRLWKQATGWHTLPSATGGANADDEPIELVLIFGSVAALESGDRFAELRTLYPDAHLVSCSTAGEILGPTVLDNSVVATAIGFRRVHCSIASLDVGSCPDSFEAGSRLVASLDREGLTHIMVFSDGQLVNGSQLVRGLACDLPRHVTISGGLAGDGTRFGRTLVGANEPPREGIIVAIGFHGPLRVGCGSAGGWEPFGPVRVITRSEGNVLYELDNRSALDLYRLYLGELANALPASAMLFPLSIWRDGESPIVRTILSIDESAGMRFAGDMPRGTYARLMKSRPDRLVDGALQAAHNASFVDEGRPVPPALAILISCVGRKVALAQRTEDEVEAIANMFGESTAIAGFYSYGELSPPNAAGQCELHNQTMTVTTFREELDDQ